MHAFWRKRLLKLLQSCKIFTQEDSVQALKVIIEEKGLDCYPLNSLN